MKNRKTDNKTISKFLSLILRHKPEVIGVTLDDNGWVDTKTLMSKINDHYRKKVLTIDKLEDIVDSDNKNRYELSTDKSKVRARQGHSISDVDLELEPKTPPERLYHGTVKRFLTSIFDNGLIKGTRQYVHLSEDKGTAMIVGGRRGVPTVLSINTEQMHKDGILFYMSSNGVWLTDYVDSKYIIIDWEENDSNN